MIGFLMAFGGRAPLPATADQSRSKVLRRSHDGIERGLGRGLRERKTAHWYARGKDPLIKPRDARPKALRL